MKKLVFIFCLLLFPHLLYAQGEPVVIMEGKTVEFDYRLTVEGDVIDTSLGRKPLEYVQGQKMIIPGLEKQMAGLKAGDEKVIIVTAEDGYGPVDPRAVIEIPLSNLGPDVSPEKGGMLQLQTQSGPLTGVIEDVKPETVIVNFNHPLAGKELKFEIKIISVK